MIPCEWAERVALFAGGDGAPDVERHVKTCADCRELLAALLADRDAIHRPPYIPDTSYEVVRAGVIARIRVGQRRLLWRPAAAAVLVATLAGATWAAYVLSRPVPGLEVVVVHPAVADVPVAREPVRARRTAPVYVRRPAPLAQGELAMALRDVLGPVSSAPAASNAPVLITASTADPDVVIVLVQETKGEVNE